MDNRHLIYEELVREEDNIVQKMIQEISKYNPELYLEWKILQKLKTKYSPSGKAENTKAEEELFPSVTKVQGTTQVVRKLFRENPATEYSPPEVRDYLKPLIEKGIITSKSRNILNIAHRALRSLTKQGFVDKIKRGGVDAVYKLKVKEKGLLE